MNAVATDMESLNGVELNQATYAASPEQDISTPLLMKDIRKHDEHREQEIRGSSNGLFSYML